MKKIIYTFALVILLSTIANAGMNFNGNNMPLDNRTANSSIMANPADMTPYTVPAVKGETLQADSSKFYFNNLATANINGEEGLIYGPHNAVFQGYGSNSTPLTYDPVSGYLFYASTNWTQDDAEKWWTYDRIFYSKDMGLSWDYEEFMETEGQAHLSPSIGVLNTQNSKNYEDLDIIFYNFYYDFVVGQYAGANLNWRVEGEVDGYNGIMYEEGKNASSYILSSSNLVAYELDGSPVVSTVQMPYRKTGATDKGGVYGQCTFNIGTFDYFINIPDAWDVDLFRPSGSPSSGSHYNSTILNDVDADGNLFAGVMGMFINENQDIRLPAISSSDDMGETWTDFDICPNSALKTFAESLDGVTVYPAGLKNAGDYVPGSDIGLVREAYGRFGFVSTGVGQVSFISKFAIWETRHDSLFGEMILAEIYYDNGTWGARKISDIHGNRKFHLSYDSEGDKFNARDDDDGEDINVGKTPEGTLVITWTDTDKDGLLVFETPLEMYLYNTNTQAYDQGFAIDTLAATDIFAAYRTQGETSWTTEQVTKDDISNKMVYIPGKLESIYNIPIIGHYSLLSTTDPMANAEIVKKQMRSDAFQGVYVLQYDFSNPHEYYLATSVEEDNNLEITGNFTLNAPVPNPASNMTELTFTLGENAYTTIELFDAIGNKVNTLQAGNTSIGVHGININTTNLTSGTYFIILTANGNRQTQLLKVIR